MRSLSVLLFFLLFFWPHISATCIRGNCKVGKGTYIFSDGSKYSGNFTNGVPHGKGRLTLVNGDRYEGSFRSGLKHGEGKYFFKSGDRYTGQFADGMMSGKGRMDYNSGITYKGHWKGGKPHGKGILLYPDGKEVSSTWENGNLVGSAPASEVSHVITHSASTGVKDCNKEYCHEEKGKFTYGDGSYFTGDFIKGNPHGQGVCYYINGDVYEGGWKNHGPNGKGVVTFANGRKYSAIWDNGKPVNQVFESPVMESNKRLTKEKLSDGIPQMYALIIGISSYNHMPALKYPDDDAYQLYAFLKSPEGGAVPEDHISILVDEAATRENIRTGMENIFGKADRDDVVILYFSGHGLQGRFLPIDFDGYQNSITYEEISNALQQSEAKNKLIIADACYSGSISGEKGSLVKDMENFYNLVQDTQRGTAIITSSRAEEKSMEYSGIRQGVFSHFLLRGMRGEADKNGDGIVTITELFNFVSEKVRTYTNFLQSPEIFGKYDSNLPVAMIRR